MKTPWGFETLVGDMGSTLSGGQKQRVILARALYRRPTILFLDEATSHLDEETEAVVARALRGLQITRVIVAHRPATIAHADKLIKLESFEQSRVAGVAWTGGEANQPSRFPGATRTIRDATQPLGIGPQRKSNETRDNQAETAVVNAEAPRARASKGSSRFPPDHVEPWPRVAGNVRASRREETNGNETEGDATRRARMLRAISLPSRARNAAVLTGALKDASGIERQAHNMDAEAEKDAGGVIVNVVKFGDVDDDE
jgi:ABC-type sulfate/molybdate transport systems ATPase subunit